MKINLGLRPAVMMNVQRLINVVSGFRFVAMIASLAWCGLHLLTGHRFSVLMFGGALVFGTLAAVGAAWMSGRLVCTPPVRQS
jgi:uncharacterized membrane protein